MAMVRQVMRDRWSHNDLAMNVKSMYGMTTIGSLWVPIVKVISPITHTPNMWAWIMLTWFKPTFHTPIWMPWTDPTLTPGLRLVRMSSYHWRKLRPMFQSVQTKSRHQTSLDVVGYLPWRVVQMAWSNDIRQGSLWKGLVNHIKSITMRLLHLLLSGILFVSYLH